MTNAWIDLAVHSLALLALVTGLAALLGLLHS